MPWCSRFASVDLCIGGAPVASDVQKLSAPASKQLLALHNYPHYSQADIRSPPGFRINHLHCVIGHGRNAYTQAARAITTGEAFEHPWVRFWRRGNGHKWAQGDVVVIAARLIPFLWTANVNKVVRVQRKPRSTAVSWGTTARHVLCGEEIVQVWQEPSGEVMFQLRSFSRPHALIAWLSYPIVCYLQRRFAIDVRNKLFAIANDKNRNRPQFPHPVERGKPKRENLRRGKGTEFNS